MSTRYACSISNEPKVAVAESKKHHTITASADSLQVEARVWDGMSSFSALAAFVRKHCQGLPLPFVLLLTAAAIPTHAQHMLATSTPSAAASASEPVHNVPSAIVIGFMGGMVKRDAPFRSEVQLAAKLREEYSSAAYVDTYENAHWKDARKKILALLDTDHDGKLSAEEKQKARIILFGHSWGASATVTLARDLQDQGIPVLLTVQVDSVHKMGLKDDDVIPSNVSEAINFYQPDGMLHGRKSIRAEDPAKTKILGNESVSY